MAFSRAAAACRTASMNPQRRRRLEGRSGPRYREPPPHRRGARYCGRHLLVPFQVHSATASQVDAPFAQDARPKCDGLVTATRGLGPRRHRRRLRHHSFRGYGAADHRRGPRRLERRADRRARSHASMRWRRWARGGQPSPPRSARRSGRIPTKSARHFSRAFLTPRQDYALFFKTLDARRPFHVRPAALHRARVKAAGIGEFESCGIDTYADEARCFSYRRSVHRNEPDYGRLIAAIALV